MDSFIIFIIAFVLLFLSAAFSGLNIGLMMVRPEELKRKAKRGDHVAKKVYRYRKNGNYLIVVVLLGNVSVISALSLVLESVAGGIIAGLLTTLLVTSFGEILPQAIFSRKGYRLSRYFFWLLDILFFLLWPIAKPVSMMLDRVLGEELPTLLSREELQHMIEDHAHSSLSAIDHDESRIVSGALTYSTSKAGDIATKLEDVVTIDVHDLIDTSKLHALKHSGHSRIPVYDPEKKEFIGILYVKDLLGRTIPAHVSKIYRDKLFDIAENTPLDTVLSRFIQTKSHLFLVRDVHNETTGIVTLEDVLEEIIRREIHDEFDINE